MCGYLALEHTENGEDLEWPVYDPHLNIEHNLNIMLGYGGYENGHIRFLSII